MSSFKHVPEKRASYHHPDLAEALIQETETLLAEGQLDNITLQTLGKRLGVATSAPYRHFASKNLLFCAVATRACGRFRDLLHAVRIQTGLPPEERLRQMVMTYFSFALENPDRYRLLFREPLLGENQTPELAESRARSFEELLLMLKECQDAGVIGQGDRERQAIFVWSTMHGMSIVCWWTNACNWQERRVTALRSFVTPSCTAWLLQFSNESLFDSCQSITKP